MNQRVLLELPGRTYGQLRAHLLQPDSHVEQAAFGFAERRQDQGRDIFRLIEWMAVPPEGFAVQTAYHFELTDEMRGSVIKRAHDLRACLVEFHCHTGRWPAAFSSSDRAGFLEFVPHVLWRLKGRPYLAVVVSDSGRDGLVWLEDVRCPGRLGGLLVHGRILPCTALTPLSMDNLYE